MTNDDIEEVYLELSLQGKAKVDAIVKDLIAALQARRKALAPLMVGRKQALEVLVKLIIFFDESSGSKARAAPLLSTSAVAGGENVTRKEVMPG